MQRASSFDKSTLSASKAFLLKIPSKIIFADAVFFTHRSIFEISVLCIFPKMEILILLARRRQCDPRFLDRIIAQFLTSDDLIVNLASVVLFISTEKT